VAIAGAAGYFYFSRAQKLTDKDTIVLADFRNTTGDPVFDGALRQGLSVELSQSPFLSLVSDQRIQGLLSLMGKPPAPETSLTKSRHRRPTRKQSSILSAKLPVSSVPVPVNRWRR
jgi:hypothetical protein